jgi:uncharacterized protein YegL
MTDPIHAYLLLDTSASMSGAPLEALKQGLTLVCATFIARSKRPVQISLIGYESAAREIKKLSDAHEFDMPTDLEAAGSSGLAGALRLVSTLIPANDAAQTPTLVYIFTDGEPTDDWEIAFAALKPRVQRIFGVLCGPAATSEILEPVLDKTFRNRELSPDLLFETFRPYN